MDEVDGMSAGDRGGVADLIASIKISKVPIICICNDRYSQKLKSLVNYCLLLSFRKPTKQQVFFCLYTSKYGYLHSHTSISNMRSFQFWPHSAVLYFSHKRIGQHICSYCTTLQPTYMQVCTDSKCKLTKQTCY